VAAEAIPADRAQPAAAPGTEYGDSATPSSNTVKELADGLWRPVGSRRGQLCRAGATHLLLGVLGRSGAAGQTETTSWQRCNPGSPARQGLPDVGFASKDERGLGISALFAGPSGTGKTMAGEVLANELRLDLYRIDLSQVVSKYIGETEKNLRRVFDAADEGAAVLLFDEADALFGKRSEVKDSHDRYANIEVSYLLQRMEAYRGLAILTTNRRDALDPAFLRRIRFVVEFPFPDAQQRAEIWRRVFPPQTPTEGLAMEKLARLNAAGGNIRNIALARRSLPPMPVGLSACRTCSRRHAANSPKSNVH